MTRDEITTITSIIEQIQQAHADLVSTWDGIPDDVMTTRPVVEWWTLKDLMGHVAMWRRVAIKFINEYRRDGAPVPLGLQDAAAIDAYNKRGAALRRDYSLARMRAEFDASLRDLIAAVEKLNDADLSKPLPPPWDPGDTLERLIAVNSYEHEPEHVEQIDEWRKAHADQH
jgi:hypothetical protein